MSEETNTPQRSILDFFKTPPKNLTTKPKDLLGFFCKKENNAQTLGISCNGKVHISFVYLVEKLLLYIL